MSETQRPQSQRTQQSEQVSQQQSGTAGSTSTSGSTSAPATPLNALDQMAKLLDEVSTLSLTVPNSEQLAQFTLDLGNAKRSLSAVPTVY